MRSADRARRWSLSAVATFACFLSTLAPVSPFFLPPGPTAAACRSKGKSFVSCSRTFAGTSFFPHDAAAAVGLLFEEQRLKLYSDGDRPSDEVAAVSKGRARRRGGVTMERPSGQFQRLAKPKFDPDNPNAVLGEIAVPGLKQVSSTHARAHQRLTTIYVDVHGGWGLQNILRIKIFLSESQQTRYCKTSIMAVWRLGKRLVTFYPALSSCCCRRRRRCCCCRCYVPSLGQQCWRPKQ